MSKKGEAGLLFVVSASVRDFQTEFKKIEKDLKKFGKSMQNVGRDMSMAITAPLLAMGAGAVMAFNESEKAMAQVRAGLKSTGGVVGYTEGELQKMAVALQDISKFDDDEILKEVTANMLTFTNVVGENFKEAQLQALNLASRLDGDLQSATIMLGKALNDPIDGMKKMSRVGVQFTDEQVALVAALQKTGDMAGAQSVILKELERQYGGSAVATLAGIGPLQQLSKLIADTSEEFGRIIFESIKPFILFLKDVVTSIRALSDEKKKLIVIVSALAASIGPLLYVFGLFVANVIPKILISINMLSNGFRALFAVIMANPIGSIATVIGVVLGAMLLFRKETDSLTSSQWKLGDALRDVNQKLGEQIYNNLVIGAKKSGTSILEFTGSIDKLKESVEKLTKEELESLRMYLEDKLKTSTRDLTNATNDLNKEISKQDIKNYNESLGIVNTELSKFTSSTTEAKTEQVNLNKELQKTVDLIKNMKPISREQGLAKKEGPFSGIQVKTKPIDSGGYFREIIDAAYELRLVMQDVTYMIGESLTSAFESAMTSGGNFFKVLGEGLYSIVKRLIAAVLAAVALATVLSFIMPTGAAGALKFLNIDAKGFAGLFGGLFKGLSGVGMANGGIVPPGYPSDSYPAMLTSGEMVVPPQKLAGLTAGGGNFTVDIRGKMKGSDIVFEMERFVMNRQRNIGR